MRSMASYLILDRLGVVLAATDAPEDALFVPRTAYPDRHAWVTRAADGTVLGHRFGLPTTAPPPCWPRPALAHPARGCPVLAALAHPRTLDSLAAVLPAWERRALARRLLDLLDLREATFGYDASGERVWTRTDPSSGEGKVAS